MSANNFTLRHAEGRTSPSLSSPTSSSNSGHCVCAEIDANNTKNCSVGVPQALLATIGSSADLAKFGSHLPLECLQAIFAFCSPRTICCCAAVCKEWHVAATAHGTWQKFQTFGILQHYLPCLDSVESPLDAFNRLRRGIPDEQSSSILTVDPVLINPTLTIPDCNSLPLCSLSRSIIKYTTQKETAGYSGRLGSILLLWLHQIQGVIKPNFHICPGAYVVSLRVGGSREEVEGMDEASAEGKVHVREEDTRLGADMQFAVDLFAGMDLLAESPCSDLLMLCRRRALQGEGKGMVGHAGRFADLVDSSAAQVKGEARQRVAYSGPLLGRKGDGSSSDHGRSRGITVNRVTWNQKLVYTHRFSVRVGFVAGEILRVGGCKGVARDGQVNSATLSDLHLELDSKFTEAKLEL